MHLKSLPKSLWAFFWSFIKPRSTTYAIIILLMASASFTGVIQPYMLKMIIDSVVDYTGDRAYIFGVVALPLIAYILFNILHDFSYRIYEWIRMGTIPNMKIEMRSTLFNYTMQHSHRYFQEKLSGSLSNKIMDMVRGFENIDLCVVDIFIPCTLSFLMSSVILWTVHWSFGLFIFFWFILYNAFLIIYGKKCLAYSDEQSEANSHLSGRLVDVFRNMATVRMFARIPFENSYFNKFQEYEKEKFKNVLRHTWYTHLFQGIASTIMMCAMILTAIYGWQQGWVSIGDFTLITQTSYSLMIFCWWMGSQYPYFFKELGVCKQALELINTPHEITDSPGAKAIHVTKGNVRFTDVSFHYVPGRYIFKSHNLDIQPGEKIGLVGYSGSGKTTFVNLIQRYYDIPEGKILIDNQDISKVSQQSLREQIAVIPQDPILFNRTLMENIRYGRLNATDEEVMEAAKLAHCHEFITELKEGYHSLVGEGGVKLSGGQRQRIAIARALLKNAPILILDEATSALDSVTERMIQKSLYNLMKDKTTIVIAHRLSTLLHMDRILVFKAGQIIESGTHSKLLEINGYYAHLWNLQNHGFLPDEEEQAEVEENIPM